MRQFLGSFGRAFQDIPYPHAESALVLTGSIKANWKTVGDNFSEANHISSIHPKTLAPVYAGAANPGTRPVNAGFYGPHRTIGTWLNTKYAPDRRAQVMQWIDRANQTVTGTQQEGEASLLSDHPCVNPTNGPEWASDVNGIFPNWHCQISANRSWTHEFWPTGVGSADWEGRFYQPRPQTVRARIQLEHFKAMIADTLIEDLSNIENTQKGMESGAKAFVHLHDSEILIRHSLHQVMKWTKATTVADALREEE